MAPTPMHVSTNMDYGSRFTLEQVRGSRTAGKLSSAPFALPRAQRSFIPTCTFCWPDANPRCVLPAAAVLLFAVWHRGRQRGAEAASSQHRRDRGASEEAEEGADGLRLQLSAARKDASLGGGGVAARMRMSA